MKLALVGGNFTEDGGKPSKIVGKMIEMLNPILSYNGGFINDIEVALCSIEACQYDMVIWMPSVPNDVPKMRNVKERAPHTFLVTSKRNERGKYSRNELLQHALGLKANLFIEVDIPGPPVDGIVFRLMDPLNNVYEVSTDIKDIVTTIQKRYDDLKSVIRRPTISDSNKPIYPHCNKSRRDFIAYAKLYADKFHDLIHPKDTDRFLGNTSFRCESGFPTFRDGRTQDPHQMIFVSRRNLDKRDLELDNFVAVDLKRFKSTGNIYFYGEDKPSVDTPVQLDIYKHFPHINFMIHGHVYIKNAPFTKTIWPCGAVQEAGEIIKMFPYDVRIFAVNMKGHGFLIGAENVHDLNFNLGSFVPRETYDYEPNDVYHEIANEPFPHQKGS